MVLFSNFLRGIHYRNARLYDLQNFLKLGRDFDLRFKIAAQYIRPGESVLDLCAGPGRMKDYLPEGCSYIGMDASPQFVNILRRKEISVLHRDLHSGLKADDIKADVALMIVSLCHFRHTTADEILEVLKRTVKRVVIVEDVLAKARRPFIRWMMNYFCQTEYYRPIELFTAQEFQELMQRHGYACVAKDQRYFVGIYPREA